MAIESFRRDGRSKWFPDLQKFLQAKNATKSDFSDFSLGGFGYEDKWHLTKEEYLRFKEAYDKSKRGKK